MRVLLSAAAALALMVLSSCDCIKAQSGVVTDASTGEPLAGVLVKVVQHGEDTATTEADGRYVVSGYLGGFDCPSLTVEFSKAGYVTRTVHDPEDVELVPE